VQILIKHIRLHQRANIQNQNWRISKEIILKSMQSLLRQKLPLVDSIEKALTICMEVEEDRKNHIQAIEVSCNKKFYDNKTEYQIFVLETQGKEEYDDFINNIKKESFGPEYVHSINDEHRVEELSKHMHLVVKLSH
jgi:molecular chaperone GrpE (heat shock protein)